ncbi:MAG: hypothetical protein KC561_21920, partial [Myxococcales bacterium]|nr:hypothetical protein [Myxococcales bacterium]
MTLTSLDPETGAHNWTYNLASAGNYRPTTVRFDGDALYVGGLAESNASFICRIDVSGATPELDWSATYATFSNVRSIHMVDDDLLFAVVEFRGLGTKFAAMGVSTEDGSVVWSKVWDDANAGDNNNSLSGALVNGEAIIAGRIAYTPFDTQGGDGFMVSLDPQ